MQNTTDAVMQQRRSAKTGVDDFPTPSFAVRAACKHVFEPLFGHRKSVWEPTANRGSMVRALAEHFETVYGSDLIDYGAGFDVRDFLNDDPPPGPPFDLVITNPPFIAAEAFVHRALEVATVGCAMLVRTSWLGTQGRYQRLFRVHPPAVVAQYVERVPMVQARLDRDASTATEYCWAVWRKLRPEYTQLIWIPPCRAEFDRDEDWPEPEPEFNPVDFFS